MPWPASPRPVGRPYAADAGDIKIGGERRNGIIRVASGA